MTFAAEDRAPPNLSGPASLDGVKAVLLMYPYCSLPARSRTQSITAGITVDAVLAGRDLVASTADCRHVLERAQRDGAAVSFELWPDVTHAFDEAGNPDPRMNYDPLAAQAAHQRLIDLLSTVSAQ